MPTFLHAGCGPKRKDQTTRGFATPEWQELRLDIDPAAAQHFPANLSATAPAAGTPPPPG